MGEKDFGVEQISFQSGLSKKKMQQNLHASIPLIYIGYRWDENEYIKRSELKVYNNWQYIELKFYDKNNNCYTTYNGFGEIYDTFVLLDLERKQSIPASIILPVAKSSENNLLIGTYISIASEDHNLVSGKILFRQVASKNELDQLLKMPKTEIEPEIIAEILGHRRKINNKIYQSLDELSFSRLKKQYEEFVGLYEMYVLSNEKKAVLKFICEIQKHLNVRLNTHENKEYTGFFEFKNNRQIIYFKLNFEQFQVDFSIYAHFSNNSILTGTYSGTANTNKPMAGRLYMKKDNKGVYENKQSSSVSIESVEFEQICKENPNMINFFLGNEDEYIENFDILNTLTKLQKKEN